MTGFAKPHPAACLLSWGLLVVAVQGLSGKPLAFAVLSLLLLGLVWAREHLVRLLKRARILLLTIAILFCCGTPGEALALWLGVFSPTMEGMALAGEHGSRLVAVLVLLAFLFQYTRPVELVAGIHGLLAPFSFTGLAREKVALRLLLVLQYAQEQKSAGRLGSWRQWLDWLECHDVREQSGEPFHIPVLAWGGSDWLLVAVALAFAVAVAKGI